MLFERKLVASMDICVVAHVYHPGYDLDLIRSYFKFCSTVIIFAHFRRLTVR